MNRSFIWHKNFRSRLFRFVTMYAFDGQTDFDSNRPRVCIHSCTAKMHTILWCYV